MPRNDLREIARVMQEQREGFADQHAEQVALDQQAGVPNLGLLVCWDGEGEPVGSRPVDGDRSSRNAGGRGVNSPAELRRDQSHLDPLDAALHDDVLSSVHKADPSRTRRPLGCHHVGRAYEDLEREDLPNHHVEGLTESPPQPAGAEEDPVPFLSSHTRDVAEVRLPPARLHGGVAHHPLQLVQARLRAVPGQPALLLCRQVVGQEGDHYSARVPDSVPSQVQHVNNWLRVQGEAPAPIPWLHGDCKAPCWAEDNLEGVAGGPEATSRGEDQLEVGGERHKEVAEGNDAQVREGGCGPEEVLPAFGVEGRVDKQLLRDRVVPRIQDVHDWLPRQRLHGDAVGGLPSDEEAKGISYPHSEGVGCDGGGLRLVLEQQEVPLADRVDVQVAEDRHPQLSLGCRPAKETTPRGEVLARGILMETRLNRAGVQLVGDDVVPAVEAIHLGDVHVNHAHVGLLEALADADVRQVGMGDVQPV
mmetsp:Transcript_2926/g.7003  ORF Transcript_2926/g.7003 Transcript_2926/m.7003 type:complete len:476 (+) Transcript_2926:5608-7035(+)|eukprot:764923-Hanusia_phi.AAC.2